MTIAVVTMYDATHDLIRSLPRGQAAGYTTGSGGIAWTPADWAAHPGAVRIDQSASARDPSADVLDVENGAATPAECAGWYRAALVHYRSAVRPGQRHPALYLNGSNLTAALNDLIAAGVTSGPGIWLADWNLTRSQAAARITGSSGPFPVVAVQYANAGNYDVSVVSVPWLQAISGPMPPPVPPPTAVPPDWTEQMIMALPTLGPSDTDQALGGALLVHRIQLLVSGIGAWNGLGPVTQLTVDGVYGPATIAGVKAVQAFFGLSQDAICGQATWHHLVTGG